MNITENAYCRLCAVNKSEKQILNLQSDAIERMVNKLTLLNCQIDFSDANTLPKSVCLVCVNSLTRAYVFVTAVKSAQVVLKEIFPQVPIKKEVVYLDHDYSTCDPLVGKNDENIIIKRESENAEASFQPQKVQDDENTESKIEIANVGSYVDVYVQAPSEASTLPDSQKKDVKKLSIKDTNPTRLTLTWEHYSWTCAYCETQFPSFSELSSHSIEYHRACNAYRCADCKLKKFKLDTFLRHVRSHRKYLQMSCYKCFKIFPSAPEAFKHLASHITSHFKCEGCNICLSNSKELKTHYDSFYKNPRTYDILSQVRTDGLTCLHCNKKFRTITKLKHHVVIHTDRKRNHICEVCGKSFFCEANLAEHVRLHNEKKAFQCKICKMNFKTLRHVKRHMGVHNSEKEKPYACEQCGKRFRLPSGLRVHRIVHTDLRPHVCSYCNKGFRSKSVLVQHIRQHTGVRPYSCTICERTFTNWSNYNKHMKCRHGMNMAKKANQVKDNKK